MLYDADRVHEAASHPQPQGLYQSQLEVFLNPNDPAVCREAERKGISWHVTGAHYSGKYTGFLSRRHHRVAGRALGKIRLAILLPS